MGSSLSRNVATPAEVTLDKLNGQWGTNYDLSDDTGPMLKLQGVPWLLRIILGWIPVTVAMQSWFNAPTGLTHFAIEYKPPLGLPASREERVFNYENDEFTVPLLGKLRVRMRRATADELDEIDTYLPKGFEDKANVHMVTEHVDIDAVTHQVFGFEEIGGTRFHTRHILVRRGKETQTGVRSYQEERLRLVYNYIGPK